MPFFCGKGKETEFSFEMINQIIRQFINVKKTKKQKVVTLQVRIPRNKNLRSRKRASFSASACRSSFRLAFVFICRDCAVNAVSNPGYGKADSGSY